MTPNYKPSRRWFPLFGNTQVHSQHSEGQSFLTEHQQAKGHSCHPCQAIKWLSDLKPSRNKWLCHWIKGGLEQLSKRERWLGTQTRIRFRKFVGGSPFPSAPIRPSLRAGRQSLPREQGRVKENPPSTGENFVCRTVGPCSMLDGRANPRRKEGDKARFGGRWKEGTDLYFAAKATTCLPARERLSCAEGT